ncbi:hypothetical protein ASH01_06845 [Terrabacter sp. Soil811]|nr:hypothetical protein ASH01_06845 [Terrabacter sp. Soil811]
MLEGAAGATFTVKVAGTKLKVPSVLFDVRPKETVVDPTILGVMVRTRTAPQLSKVTLDGETAATAALLELTDNTSVLEDVRLQPFLPSPLVGLTTSVVLPVAPPALSVMTSAVESTVASRVLVTSSASAA